MSNPDTGPAGAPIDRLSVPAPHLRSGHDLRPGDRRRPLSGRVVRIRGGLPRRAGGAGGRRPPGPRCSSRPYDEPHDLRTARGQADAAVAAGPGARHRGRHRARCSPRSTSLSPSTCRSTWPTSPRACGWVQAVGAGTAQLQSAGLAEAGITLTSNGGSNSIGIAEFVMGRLLQFAKRFRELDRGPGRAPMGAPLRRPARRAHARADRLRRHQPGGGGEGRGLRHEDPSPPGNAPPNRSPRSTRFFTPDELHEMLPLVRRRGRRRPGDPRHDGPGRCRPSSPPCSRRPSSPTWVAAPCSTRRP